MTATDPVEKACSDLEKEIADMHEQAKTFGLSVGLPINCIDSIAGRICLKLKHEIDIAGFVSVDDDGIEVELVMEFKGERRLVITTSPPSEGITGHMAGDGAPTGWLSFGVTDGFRPSEYLAVAFLNGDVTA